METISKQNSTSSERFKNVAAIAVVVILVPVFIHEFLLMNKEDEEVNTRPRYTVGKVTKTSYVISASPHSVTFFTYQAGDSTYTGNDTGSVPDGQNLFLVKYSTKHPQYYKFYKRVPLLPTHVPPPEGWAEPPYPVPAEDLK